MSWHNIAKSPGMPVEVNAAAVRWSNVPLPGEIPPLSGGGKSAEAIVVEETSRSAHEHSKDAGEIASVPTAMQSGFAVFSELLTQQGHSPDEGPNQ
jgi:hypothetical protein